MVGVTWNTTVSSQGGGHLQDDGVTHIMVGVTQTKPAALKLLSSNFLITFDVNHLR